MPVNCRNRIEYFQELLSRKEIIHYLSSTGLIDPILNARQQEINRMEANIRSQLAQQFKSVKETIMWRLGDICFLLLIALNMIMLSVQSKSISTAMLSSPLQQLSAAFTDSLPFLQNKVTTLPDPSLSHFPEILVLSRIAVPGILLPLLIWFKPYNEVPKLTLPHNLNRDPLILPASPSSKKRVDAADLSSGLQLQNLQLSSFKDSNIIQVCT